MGKGNPSTGSGQNLRILVFGTFDGLHDGHKDFFRQAKEHGSHLVVVVGRDSTVEKTKGRRPKLNEQERLKAVQQFLSSFTNSIELVNEARLGNKAPPGEKLNPYKVIEEVMPDVICLGYDQTHFADKLQEKLKEMNLSHIKIYRLKPYHPEKFHSSLLNEPR